MTVNETIETVTYHIEYCPKANSKFSSHKAGDWRFNPFCKNLNETSAKAVLEWNRKNFHYNNYRVVKAVSTQTILDW